MLAYICEHYPALRKHVVFADTGWEHADTEEWCRSIVSRFGLELHVARNPNKTFLEMVERRGKFPGMQQRQCTSDLKRGPIQTWIRRNVADPYIVNCMGMRAQESNGRAKMDKFKQNASMTNSKRTVYDWLPIHSWSEEKIYAYLAEREIPLHPVYQYLRRFSCRLCIYMTKEDVKAVATHDPEAIEIVAALEEKIGFTMFQSGSIKALVA